MPVYNLALFPSEKFPSFIAKSEDPFPIPVS